jgi:hypothetical protein
LVRQVVEYCASVISDELIRGGFRGGYCISATRVAVDVLHTLGIQAVPLSVNLFVLNAPLVARLRSHGRLPDTGRELDQWNAEDGSCLQVIGGGGSRPGVWPGHLVTVVERAWMIDLSLKQAELRQRGVQVPGFLVWPASRKFLRGQESLDLATAGRAGLIYEAKPRDSSYHTTPLWNRKTESAPIVRSVLNRLGARPGQRWERYS